LRWAALRRTCPMTDPTDETQPHPTAGAGSADSGAVPESPASPIAPPPPDAPPSADPPPPPSEPPLRADPDRPTSDWREPPWFPPRERARDGGPSLVA